MADLLSEKEVYEIVRTVGVNQIMDDLYQRLFDGISRFSDKLIFCPEREGFSYSMPSTGLIEWMPLYDERNQRVMIKTVGYHPDNPKARNLPTILSNSSLYDVRSGELICVFESTLATAMRTGAASAIATKALAHPKSKRFGFIGCGAQAVTQAHALSRVFDINELLYFDIDQHVEMTFEKRCDFLEGKINFAKATIDEIVTTCDVVTTATTIEVGKGPLFERSDTLPHVHFNAVGSDFPGKIELPYALLKESFICPDHLEQAIKEGECQQLAANDIGPSLASLIQHADLYSAHQLSKTVFDSTGWSFEDWIVMELFLGYAKSLGLQTSFHMNQSTNDVTNPYAAFAHPTPEIIELLRG